MKSLKQIREASGGKEAYQKFFNSLLKKFGVSSPSELEGKKKKDFFDAIDKGWDGDNEPKEKGESVKEAKKLKGGKGKAELDINLDVSDFKGGEKAFIKFASTKYKVKIKPHRYGAIISGDKAKLLAFLLGQDYGMDSQDIEDLYPEVLESSDDFEDDYDETDDKGNYSGVEESLEKPETQPVTKDTEAEAVELKKLNEIRMGKPIKGKLGKTYPVMNASQKKKVIAIAKKHSGNMQRAMKEIDKLRKNLTDNPDVMDILKKANESLDLQGTGDAGTSKSVEEAKGDQPGQAEYYKKVDKVNAKYGIGPHGKSLGDLSAGEVKKYFKDYDKAMKENVNEATIHITNELSEKLKAGKGKETVGTDVDWDEVGDEKKWIKQAKSKYKVTIKKDVGKYHSGASISGEKANIIKFLQGPMYGGVEDRDIEDMWPWLLEAVDCDGRLLGFKAATRRKEGEKQKGSVLVDRRTKGYKEAQIRREKAQAKREEKRKQEEFAKKYPKLEYNKNSDEENEALMKKINKNFVPETAANAAGSGSGVDMAPNAGKKKKDKFKVVKRANY